MKTKRPVPWRRFVLLATLFLAYSGALVGDEAAANKQQADDATAVKEFNVRVQDYLKLRQTIEKQLPPMKSKEALPEMINAHQQALARKIREARPNAKAGDIFTPAVREAFRDVIRSVFQAPQNSTALANLRQRDTVKEVHLQVDGNYPDAVAETTFPPTLLQRLPVLPDPLAYRIMGRDLVLVDKNANLVVDLFHEALP